MYICVAVIDMYLFRFLRIFFIAKESDFTMLQKLSSSCACFSVNLLKIPTSRSYISIGSGVRSPAGDVKSTQNKYIMFARHITQKEVKGWSVANHDNGAPMKEFEITTTLMMRKAIHMR